MSETPRFSWNVQESTRKPSVALNALAKECGVSEKKIQEVMQQLGCAKPERENVLHPRPGKSPMSKSVLSCSFADAERVRRYFGVHEVDPVDETIEDVEIPDDYVTLGRLGMKLGLDKAEMNACLHEIRLTDVRGKAPQTPFGALHQASTSEDIIEIKGVTHVSPEIAARLLELSEQIFRKADARKYADGREVIQELNISGNDRNAREEQLQYEINGFVQKYPWLAKEITEKINIFGEPPTTYYSRDLISFIRKMSQGGSDAVEAVEGIPVGYTSQSDIANSLRLFPAKLELLVKKVLAESTDMERPVVALFLPDSVSKRIAYFYSPELVEKIIALKTNEDILQEEKAENEFEELITFDTESEVPSGYLSVGDSTSILRIGSERLRNLADEVSREHPEFVKPAVTVFKNNRSLRPRIFYSQEVVKAVRELKETRDGQNLDNAQEQVDIPEGYISRTQCAIDLAISMRNLTLLANECVNAQPELEAQEFVITKRGRTRDFNVFYSPKLVSAITEKKREHEERMLRRREDELRLREETISLKESLAALLIDAARGQEETKLFRKTMALFGGARTLDILYTLYPDFKKLSAEYIQKELATHLSDHMVSRAENVVDDLEISLPFLKEKVFKDTLFTILKDYCVTNYSKKKREDRERSDTDILEEYITTLKGKAAYFKNTDFNDVVEYVEEYVTSLLNDFTKPDAVVDELGSGRKFPDLNQIVNIKEVADQRRVLIGDEMGMGKSGSAILSKEYLGLGTAIVIVPSNAVDLWKEYLSDSISSTGKQVGYFKPGKAPRVLEMQRPEDANQSKSGEYDYVIVSHDRITEESADTLRNIPYEMVIIDEAHKFKNITVGKRSEALLNLLEDCEDRDTYTVMLSGTPIPNKIKDMAIVLKLLYPETYGRIENNVLVASIIKGDLVGLRELLLKRTQMKKLSESVEMPEKEENMEYVALSEEERELYQILMEDDQFTAMERISALRLFCLNPKKVFPDRETRGSKVVHMEKEIANFFETKNKLVLFMNGYVSGVIRGENSILSQMNVPEGVTVRVIDGEVSREERRSIEEELKGSSTEKILLVVNGGAVDVAVDFSAADGVKFYNEPWTKFDKMQQTSRVYRPGLTHDITVDTSIVKDTIEEGIHKYIEMKYRAVVKLLEGIPLSELEKSLLILDERTSDTVSIDRDLGLAEEWLQTPMGRMNNFSKMTKEIGEKEFRSAFLEEHSEAYASVYETFETQSIQANTARFVSALVDEYRREKNLPDDIIILDLASGPEMLRKRMRDEFSANVYSLDINEEHFKEQNGRQVVGGFVTVPFFDSSVDYVNLSHALHYSSFRPEKGNYERLHVLAEIARVLKVGGRATINLAHTQRFKSMEAIRELVDEMGLMVIDSATGVITSGDCYKSFSITLEKIEEIDLPSTIKELRNRRRHLLYGLRLDMNIKSKKLQGSQKITRSFTVNDRVLETALNREDMSLLTEQESIQDEGVRLMKEFGESIDAIPKEEILKRGYLRYTSGKKSRLVKKGSYSKNFVYVD